MRVRWFLARVVSLLGPWESAVATFPVWPEFLVSGLRSASCWSPCVCEATASLSCCRRPCASMWRREKFCRVERGRSRHEEMDADFESPSRKAEGSLCAQPRFRRLVFTAFVSFLPLALQLCCPVVPGSLPSSLPGGDHLCYCSQLTSVAILAVMCKSRGKYQGLPRWLRL